MEYRRLGRTNLMVSAIGFGGARLDEHPEQATATVRRAREWGVFRSIFGDYASTPWQAALFGLLLHPAVTSVLSGMSLPEIADENCAVGDLLETLPESERAGLRQQVDALGIGPCRSCGRCAPYTQGIPVNRIMTYRDAEIRFGIAAARKAYESFRDRVLAADSFPGADAVCPEGFDVLAEVKRAFV